MCTIMVRLLGEKLFCSFESVFELNRGLRDSQTSMNNKDLNLGLLVKKEAGYTKTTFDHLFYVFWLSPLLSVDQLIYFMLLLGFKNSKSLIKKFIQGKDVTVTNVLSCYRHFSKIFLYGHFSKVNHLSLNNHLVLLVKLLIYTENKLKRKDGHSHREKVGSLCQKGKRKWITFF